MNCLKHTSLLMAALTVSATVFAATDLDTRVRELEQQMKQVRIETTEKTFGANLASSRPYVDGHGFSFSFDVLYWQVKTGGTEYCSTSRNLNATEEAVLPISGYLKELDFSKWDWGFRAGAGYNFDHGDWDIYANYTYFTNDNSTMTTAPQVYPVNFDEGAANPPSSPNTANLPDYSNIDAVAKATSQLRYRFNRIDLELGRGFFVDKYLSIRPHVGLMTAWITQNQKTQFTGGDLNLNTVTLNQHNKYWGIGPRMGLNTKWSSCNGFGVIGNVSGALPYGRFNLDWEQAFSANSAKNSIDVDGDMHRFTPTVQMQLGFGYDKAIACDTHHVSLFLAWDIQYWWRVSQHMVNELNYARIGEDLSMQGLTFHVKWDF